LGRPDVFAVFAVFADEQLLEGAQVALPLYLVWSTEVSRLAVACGLECLH
jgi:hypothetical protein